MEYPRHGSSERQTLKQLQHLLEAFIGGPNRSILAANEIEGLLLTSFRGDDRLEDLLIALASYRPEGGEYLYDEASIRHVCADALAEIHTAQQVTWTPIGFHGRRSAGRVTIEKRREIITGILHGAPNFQNRVHCESIENSLDPLAIDLSVNAREVAEANRDYAANPGRRVRGESQALRLHPSPISASWRSVEAGRMKPVVDCGRTAEAPVILPGLTCPP